MRLSVCMTTHGQPSQLLRPEILWKPKNLGALVN